MLGLIRRQLLTIPHVSRDRICRSTGMEGSSMELCEPESRQLPGGPKEDDQKHPVEPCRAFVVFKHAKGLTASVGQLCRLWR